MKTKQKQIFLLGFLILLLILINYSFIDNFLVETFDDKKSVFVSRIIDGDTVEVGNESIRLMGINCPERGEKYYLEAKEFLEDLILNETVKIESFGEDRYYRELGYVFYKNQNVNIKLVEEGLANIYILENRKYKEELDKKWEKCLEENINLCEKSENKCAECIILNEFNFKEDFVIFENVCDFSCDLNGWLIKDEGRKKFIFDFVLNSGKEVVVTAEDFGKDYVWTDTGDTLFLRDDEGKLVLWESY